MPKASANVSAITVPAISTATTPRPRPARPCEYHAVCARGLASRQTRRPGPSAKARSFRGIARLFSRSRLRIAPRLSKRLAIAIQAHPGGDLCGLFELVLRQCQGRRLPGCLHRRGEIPLFGKRGREHVEITRLRGVGKLDRLL